MAKKIAIVAKTNLNTDGRILNQLKILSQHFSDASISFILLPDKKTEIALPKGVSLIEVNPRLRHSDILRPLTVFVWTISCLRWLFKLNPNVVHAHDSAVVSPIIIYKLLKGKSVKIIYDDHELPNENEHFTKKWMDSLENSLIRKADNVLFANLERLDYIKQKLELEPSKLSYFLNMNYFADHGTSYHDPKIEALDVEIASGTKMIIHQGPLKQERGRQLLAEFSKKLPAKIKILLLGGSETDFNLFVRQHRLDSRRFFFVGTVSYYLLPMFWSRGQSAIVLYLPNYINNRLCAPNRFFLSMEYGLPVIVNRDNPVLHNFVKEFEAGFFIDEFFSVEDFDRLFSFDGKILESKVSKLKDKQINSFISLYKEILLE